MAGTQPDRANLAGEYFLDESSGTNCPDTSGNSKDFTCNNMEDGDWVAGKIDNALRFGGTDEYAEAPAAGDFYYGRTTDFSLECWMSSSQSISIRAYFLAKGCGNAQPCYGLRLHSGTPNGQILAVEHGATNVKYRLTNSAYTDGSYHHVVWVTNGTSDGQYWNIYVDGSEASCTSSTGTLSQAISPNPNKLRMAATGDLYYEEFEGDLDIVRIWTTNLTSDNVTYLWNGGVGIQEFTAGGSDDHIKRYYYR